MPTEADGGHQMHERRTTSSAASLPLGVPMTSPALSAGTAHTTSSTAHSSSHAASSVAAHPLPGSIPPRFPVRLSPLIRVLLADDHPVVRIGLKNMLQADETVEFVGEASDGDEAITQTLGQLPDILLLDLMMPRLPGLEAMRAILRNAPSVKIILLTGTITTQQIIEALQIGARGIVLKDALTDHLTTAIHAVASGDYWIGGKRVANLVGALRDLMQQAAVPERKTYGLTPRELEVVGCIVEGCSNRDVAKQFGLSEETVKRHLSNIFDKTGVSTRLELALFAIAHRLVDAAL